MKEYLLQQSDNTIQMSVSARIMQRALSISVLRTRVRIDRCVQCEGECVRSTVSAKVMKDVPPVYVRLRERERERERCEIWCKGLGERERNK